MKSRTGTSIIWTDEKIFTVEQAFNSHNARVLSKDIQEVSVRDIRVFRRMKPASVMV